MRHNLAKKERARYYKITMENFYETHSVEETKAVAEELAKYLQPSSLLCLSGDLGAGKTTFTQGLLEALGADGPYVSPTFVIMKEYDLKEATKNGIKRIYHADAYRIEEKDFEILGFAEWVSDPEGLVILEWPERIQNLLPEKRMDISLEQKNERERVIRIDNKEGTL